MSAKGSCQNTKFIIYGKHEICEKEKKYVFKLYEKNVLILYA